MIKRVIEISSPAHLKLRQRQIFVFRPNEKEVSIPVEDVGVIILSNPAITHTQKFFAECAKENIAVIMCDSHYMPCMLMHPLYGHSLHAKIIKVQIAATAPAKKRIWQSIIRAKIRHQAHVLRESARADVAPLLAMAEFVRSGDTGNMEAQAARFYWTRLFGKEFRRHATGANENMLLNYGYAVIRAATARAISGAGLHPSLGIHHHNQYDALCLADDLMEPLRPFVDFAVWEIRQNHSGVLFDMSPETKKQLLAVLSRSCKISGGKEPLMVALHAYAASFRKCLAGEEKVLKIPEFA